MNSLRKKEQSNHDSSRTSSQVCRPCFLRRPLGRIAQAVANSHPGLAGLQHCRTGRGPGRGMSRAGHGVRRYRPLYPDRRGTSQPDLRSVLAYGTRPLRRFHGQFSCTTQTCHTGDNFGVGLTIPEYVGGSGRDLMLAVALGYTVQSRLVDHANFMSSGFDHTSQLAFSLNAAAGRLLGLSEQQIANAIAMAAVSDASFAVVRAKPLSQWKCLASAQSALGAMNTLFLARRGVQGPLQVVEGPLGIDHLLRMKINIDWDKQGYEGVVESTIKKYNSMIHTQSSVHCMVEIARQNKIDPSKVVSIEAEVFQLAYDFAGGGL